MTRWSIATFAGLVLGTLLWLAIAAAVGTFGHRISRWDYTFRGGPSDDARLVAWLAEQPGFLRPQVERQPGRLRVRYLYDEPHADVNDKAVEFALRYLFGYDVTWTSSRLGSWAPVALLEDDTGEQLRCGCGLAVGLFLAWGTLWWLDRRRRFREIARLSQVYRLLPAEPGTAADGGGM